jgi:hypothetical protein
VSRNRNRIGLWGAVALAAALLATALLWPRAPHAPTPPQVAAAPEPLASFDPEPAAPAPEPALAEIVAVADGFVPLAHDAARDYRERADFPEWSFAIEDGIDPLERDRSVSPQRSHPADLVPVLVVEPEQVSFEAPRPVVIRARLEDGTTLALPRSIRGEVRDVSGETRASVRFEDDGVGFDAAEDDRLYTATFTPGEGGIPEMQGAYLIEVIAKVETDPEPRVAVSGFLYSVPKAELTGRFRDHAAAGSLVVEAELEVFEASRFHLEATLASETGRALAWAQEARALSTGSHWVPLSFYGLALQRAGVDGPYRLRSIALQSTDEMPARKSDLLTDAHTTAFYRANEFTRDPFGDAELLEAAERLEASTGFPPERLEAGAPAPAP